MTAQHLLSRKINIAKRESNKVLNTHFVTLKRPMGMVMGNQRFAQDTRNEIIEYHNVPAAEKNRAQRNPPCLLYSSFLAHNGRY